MKFQWRSFFSQWQRKSVPWTEMVQEISLAGSSKQELPLILETPFLALSRTRTFVFISAGKKKNCWQSWAKFADSTTTRREYRQQWDTYGWFYTNISKFGKEVCLFSASPPRRSCKAEPRTTSIQRNPFTIVLLVIMCLGAAEMSGEGNKGGRVWDFPLKTWLAALIRPQLCWTVE